MPDERHEILIQRVADGAASAEDFAELARGARAEPELWQRCADEVVARRLTLDAAGAAQRVASRVTLPVRRRAMAPGGAWGGWAAALFVAFAWLVVSSLTPPPPAPPTVEPVRSIEDHDAPELFRAYVARGRRDGQIIEVLPSVPIEMRKNDDGSAVVFRFVRRVVEETTLDGTVRMATDDAGRPRLVPKPVPAGSREAM